MSPSPTPRAPLTTEDRMEILRQLGLGPLPWPDPRYVPLVERTDADPLPELLSRMDPQAGSSTQLLMAYRGTGKSTQLNRLEAELWARGFKPILVDAEKYLNIAIPPDLVEFIVALVAAFSERLARPELLGEDLARGFSLGEWLKDAFSGLHINVSQLLGFAVKAVPLLPQSLAEIPNMVQRDEGFRARLRAALSGHVSAFVEAAHAHIRRAVAEIRKRNGPMTQVAFLVDSVERIQGTPTTARAVSDAVGRLFSVHGEDLCFPDLHTVYTVHPSLRFLIGADRGGMRLPVRAMTSLKLRDPTTGEANLAAVELMERVVSSRTGDWRRLFESKDALDHVLLESGGSLRDTFHILEEVLRRPRHPLTLAETESLVDSMRTEYEWYTKKDAAILWEVQESREIYPADDEEIPLYTKLLDLGLILTYRNGREWADVHPMAKPSLRRRLGRKA